jgi:pimeloyl-ACP methyl ester carboxylesterase
MTDRPRRRRGAVPLLLALLLPACVQSAAGPATAAGAAAATAIPPFECEAYVAYDRDMKLPGYILPTSAGPRTCIPFTSVLHERPAGYRGDYYVDEFTDAKLRERWRACKADTACHERVFAQVMKRKPPNREYALRDPRGRYLLGKVDEKGADTDLGTVRRPGFFARQPYVEPIAAVDGATSVVEFTVPAEAYERIHMGMTGDVRIRGWYIKGRGLDDGKGGRRRALIVMSGGGGDRIAAIDDPRDVAYVVDAQGVTVPNDDWPNATTGVQGQRKWREVYRRLNAAGFDIVALDRRGIGMSGGYSDTNTLQQGHDLLDVVEALRTGFGMRALSPGGALTSGRAAAEAVRGGPAGTGLPTFFLGSSRGTMASGWAMTINFDKDCSYDLPTIQCGPPRGDASIKGALLVAEFSSGAGYIPAQSTPKDDGRGPGRDRGLFIGGIEEEHNIVFFPSSAILAGIHTWPSAFFARGLWCYADGLEGTMESYRRVNGLKELVVVRGPHAFTTWPDSERDRTVDRMIAYARAVVLGGDAIPGQRQWSDMKQLVATASDVWEPSTKPTLVN